MTATEKIDLSPFSSSENFYKHWLGLIYTDGVKFVADECGAYWLIDAIASHQPKARRDPMLRDFQIWTLTSKPTKGNPRRVILECFRDTGCDASIKQTIPYSDFPFDRMPEDFQLYVENGTICLPEER
jgi:hypothetical protein